MSARRFLLDGYNILHALGLPAQLEPGQLQHARRRLISLIASKYPHDSVTIVFDAHQSPRGSQPQQTVDGIEVVFARGIADDLIDELVSRDAATRTLFVVSSDRGVQRAARRRDAKVVEALDFLEGLYSAPPPPALPIDKPIPASDDQIWLDAFQSIDQDTELQSMQRIDALNPDPGKTKRHRSTRKPDRFD